MTTNTNTALNPEQLGYLKSQLRDIHLPTSIDWWPPAPGWWLLGTLLVVLVFFAVRWLIKFWRIKTMTELLQSELTDIRIQHQITGPSVTTINACAILLKRICLACHDREQIAPLTGQALTQFINQQSQPSVLSASSIQLLDNHRFQQHTPDEQSLNQLLNECQQWINTMARRLV